MKFLRNSESRHLIEILLLLGIIVSSISFIFNQWTGILTGVAFLLVLLFCSLDAYFRARRLCAIAEKIDQILHGQEYFDFSSYREGELSILENEISKLTIKLRDQADLLQKDKVSLADSIADISHQIRTPMTAIHLLLESLQDASLSEEKRNAQLYEIYRQLSHIDWLVVSLLKIAKLDSGTIQFQKESVNLSVLVQTALTPLLIPMELREQTIQRNCSGSFFGDLSWTAEALSNILKNCSEHMGAGTIFLTASENPLYSEICIRDMGPGLNKEDIPYLFDRFYKGKQDADRKESTGFGIGLALARMIITRQNGTIKAENHPEGGAFFTIRFYKSII